MNFKYIVVGAGLAGLTMAERIANVLCENVLIIEKREHIGGNIYDSYDKNGILIHNYGPHIFHTNDKSVYEYLSEFTKWNDFQHRVLTFVDGNYIPMPISVDTINELYNLNLSSFEMKNFIDSQRMDIKDVKTSKDVVLSKAGNTIYEKFFENYTKKQWGVDPACLDTSVISRIPFRFNRDTRYFSDRYQGMPKHGYTKMCEAMIKNPKIKLLLKTDYKEIIDSIDHEFLIYTGPVDYYFDYKHGKLKYRSIRFEYETYDFDSYQKTAVVNYPNDYDYTRITEFKKMTWQEHNKTTIMKEYPCDGEEPFYPFPTDEWKKVFAQYKYECEREKNTIFVGRLAEYKYYNMDAVVRRALDLFEDLKRK